MAKENLTKDEHFHENNADMKLYFEKPDDAEIDEMNYKKPITSYKDTPSKEFEYMDGRTVMDTPNSDFMDDAPRAPGSNKSTHSTAN